jgi:predicted transcriptional regulator
MVNPKRELEKRLRGRSQVEVAREIGVHETYISNFLAGNRGPNGKLLAYLGLQKQVRVIYHRINGASP